MELSKDNTESSRERNVNFCMRTEQVAYNYISKVVDAVTQDETFGSDKERFGTMIPLLLAGLVMSIDGRESDPKDLDKWSERVLELQQALSIGRGDEEGYPSDLMGYLKELATISMAIPPEEYIISEWSDLNKRRDELSGIIKEVLTSTTYTNSEKLNKYSYCITEYALLAYKYKEFLYSDLYTELQNPETEDITEDEAKAAIHIPPTLTTIYMLSNAVKEMGTLIMNIVKSMSGDKGQEENDD